MKKVTLLLMCAVLVFCMFGCAQKPDSAPAEETPAAEETPSEAPTDSSEAPAPEDIKLAYACWNLTNEWFISLVTGFEDACEELGVEAVITDSQYTIEKQLNDIENLMNSGVNGIAFCAVDETATHDMVEQAKEQGVVIASTAQTQSNANFMYALNEYDYGYIIGSNAAEWVNEQLGGEGTYVLLSKDNIDTTIARGDGIEDALKEKCPNLVQVARQAADTAETAYSIVETVLQTNPDINLVVGTEDSCVIGGYRAMQAAGAIGDDRACFSGDATSEILAAMEEEDSIYRGTVDLIPYDCGYDTAMKMYEFAINGVSEEPEWLWFDPIPVTREQYLNGEYVPKG